MRGEEVWFATTIGSKKCKDLEHEPQCALAFAGEGDGPTIFISGRGEVSRDRRLMRELWDVS